MIKQMHKIEESVAFILAVFGARQHNILFLQDGTSYILHACYSLASTNCCDYNLTRFLVYC